MKPPAPTVHPAHDVAQPLDAFPQPSDSPLNFQMDALQLVNLETETICLRKSGALFREEGLAFKHKLLEMPNMLRLALAGGVTLVNEVLEMLHMSHLPIRTGRELIDELVFLDKLRYRGFVALGDRIVPVGEYRAARRRLGQSGFGTTRKHDVIKRLRRRIGSDRSLVDA